MFTDRRIRVSRANGASSGSRKTEAGKPRPRLNAAKTGAFAHYVLNTESWALRADHKMDEQKDKFVAQHSRIQQHARAAIAVRNLPAFRHAPSQLQAPPRNRQSKNDQANLISNSDTTNLKENQTLPPTRPTRRHCTTRPPGTFHHPPDVYSVEPDKIL